MAFYSQDPKKAIAAQYNLVKRLYDQPKLRRRRERHANEDGNGESSLRKSSRLQEEEEDVVSNAAGFISAGDDFYLDDHVFCDICCSNAGETEMILCENPACNVARHTYCFDPCWEKVPETQWLCEICQSILKCAKCGESDHLFTCSKCERLYHLPCLDLNVPEVLTDWVCPFCICQKCKQHSAEERLQICNGCNRGFHYSCDNITWCTFDSWFCDDCNSPVFNEAAVSDHPVFEEGPEELDAEFEEMIRAFEDDKPFLFKNDKQLALTETSTFVDSAYEKQVAALHRLKNKRPLVYRDLKFRVDKCVLNSEDWHNLVDDIDRVCDLSDDQKSALLTQLPRKTSFRILKRIAPPHIRNTRIEIDRDNRKYEATLYHQEAIQALLRLYGSSLNRLNGPMYDDTFSDCSALRQTGGLYSNLIDNLKQKTKVPPGSIILLYQLASDKTTTNYTSLDPIMVNLVNYDADARVLNLVTSQAKFAMKPAHSNIRCFDKIAQKFVPVSSVEKDEVNSVLKEMKKKAYEVVLKDFKSLESGVDVFVRGERKRLYAVCYSIIFDLEEARDFFDLPGSVGHWHCTHCYCFCEHLKENERFRTSLQNHYPDQQGIDFSFRNDQTDEFLRTLMKDDNLDPEYFNSAGLIVVNNNDDREEEPLEKKISRLFGVKRVNACPAARKDAALYMIAGPAELRKIDLLHNSFGVVATCCRMLRFVYGPSLEEFSKILGNRTLLLQNSISFHRMEYHLRDFQYICLAIVLGECELRNGKYWPRKIDKRSSHSRLACSLLQILYILKDDASGLLLTDLAKCITAFKDEFDQLDEDLQEVVPDQKHSFHTSKIHELVEHAVDQIYEVGSIRNCSSSILEWSHPESVGDMQKGSMRLEDQGASVISLAWWRALFAEVDTKQELSSAVNFQGWRCEDIHTLRGSRERNSSTPEGQNGIKSQMRIAVLDNLEVLAVRLGVDGPDMLKSLNVKDVLRNFIKPIHLFSNSLVSYLFCSDRQVRIKSEINFTVATRSDKDLFVISYQKVGVNGELVKSVNGECNRTDQPCRHHSEANQLFASFARTASSTYGLPLLFCQDENGVSFTIMLELAKSLAADWNWDSVIIPYKPQFELKLIANKRIRDKHNAVFYKNTFYVFKGGSRVFNHL